VDLEYPQHLHDAHLPFCPTRDKPPGKRQDKLLATLYDKNVTSYIIMTYTSVLVTAFVSKDSLRIAILAIFIASQLYRTQYEF